MNIEDIRLTPDELDKLYEDYMLSSQHEPVLKAYVANTATDKAIRKFTTELSVFVEMLKSAPEMHGDIQSDIPKTYAFVNYYEALRNLIGEKP